MLFFPFKLLTIMHYPELIFWVAHFLGPTFWVDLFLRIDILNFYLDPDRLKKPPRNSRNYFDYFLELKMLQTCSKSINVRKVEFYSIKKKKNIPVKKRKNKANFNS